MDLKASTWEQRERPQASALGVFNFLDLQGQISLSVPKNSGLYLS